MFPESIEEFISLAKQHGATVKTHEERDKDYGEFNVGSTSEYSGGCGLPNCRCSPGLWVNATEGNDFVIVSWTPGLERGDPVNQFTQEQHQGFVQFCEEVGEST